MKNIFKIIGVFTLILFSFFYTEKAINVINMQDEMMIILKEEAEKYNIESINASIDNDYIYPGIYGKKINLNKSYKKMKEIGIFDSSLLIYDKVKPSISISNNYDKYIIGGNPKFDDISIIFKVDSDNEYEKVLNIIDHYNIKINIFIDYDYLSSNISNINKSDKYNYYSYGYKGKYDSDILIMSNNIINRKSNDAIYCLNEDLDSSNLEVCSLSKISTIYPSIINGDYNSIKKNITNGSIISMDINSSSIKDMGSIINYINSRDYNIVLLDELLDEDK